MIKPDQFSCALGIIDIRIVLHEPHLLMAVCLAVVLCLADAGRGLWCLIRLKISKSIGVSCEGRECLNKLLFGFLIDFCTKLKYILVSQRHTSRLRNGSGC